MKGVYKFPTLLLLIPFHEPYLVPHQTGYVITADISLKFC